MQPLRAYLGAHLAVLALVVVDLGNAVYYMNCIELTGLLAHLTADTAVGANLHYFRTLVLVHAVNVNLLDLGYQVDDLLRAGRNTLAAGNTLVGVNLCNAVHNVDCVKRTGLYAGAEAHAAKGASLRAACYTHCSVAVLQTLVVCLVLCVAAAVAVNVCNLTVAGSNLNAEYLCDLLSRSSTADRQPFTGARPSTIAAPDRHSPGSRAAQLAPGRHSRTSGTRSSTSTAKTLAGNAEQDCENDTHDEQYRYRVNNILHIPFLVSSLTKSTGRRSP